ncbi:hypothetical protein [Geodermatophilus sp. SYSU D01036]
MIRWACAVVVGAVLSGFAFLLLTGRYDNDGPVVVRMTPEHGLHLGDVFVLVAWAVAMALLLVLARTGGRPAGGTGRRHDGAP